MTHLHLLIAITFAATLAACSTADSGAPQSTEGGSGGTGLASSSAGATSADSGPGTASATSSTSGATSSGGSGATSSGGSGATSSGGSDGTSAGSSGGTGATSTGGSSTGGGSTGGMVGGCTPKAPCMKGYYCDYPDDKCGDLSDGTCVESPMFCTEEYAPVCGCDKKTYGNKCKAQAAGVDVASQGPC